VQSWDRFPSFNDFFCLHRIFSEPPGLCRWGDARSFGHQVLVNRFKIQGLAAAPDGKFLFTEGTNKVYRTADFEMVETAYQGDRPITDVALEPDTRAHGL